QVSCPRLQIRPAVADSSYGCRMHRHRCREASRMSVSGVVPTLAASYEPAGASAGASVNGVTGAAGLSSVGPAAVLQLSGAGGTTIMPTISQLLHQELEYGALD